MSDEQLPIADAVSRSFDEMLNRAPNRQAPYVGDSAFATKAGIHASAILKEPETYEHVSPDAIGNRRQCWSPIRAASPICWPSSPGSASRSTRTIRASTRCCDEVKEREALGYAYEAADASFELLARRILGNVPHYFDVESSTSRSSSATTRWANSSPFARRW